MGNVLKMDKQATIYGLLRLGWTNRAISRHTKIHRDTVASYRAEFENRPKESTVSGENGPQTGLKVPPDSSPPIPTTNSIAIQPYAAAIRLKITSGLTGRRIYQDLVEEQGYAGSYDSVKRYVRKLRKRAPVYFDKLPTSPGMEVQVDFAKAPCTVKVDGVWRHPWFFKMTLSHSRHSYEEMVWRQDLETFIRCHERAFRFFGGVPQTEKLDNLKSGVLLASLYEPQLNAVFAAFADHWGFAPNPCAPYRPNHKGRVERDVQYTESNALDKRQFESLEDGNVYLCHWNRRWARTRIHGTTKCQVWKMFVETERAALRPLATGDFPYFEVGSRKVDVNGLISVNSNFYAAPHTCVGTWVTVHHNSLWVKILDSKQQVLVAHRTLLGKGKICQPHECKPPYKHRSLEHQERYYCGQASAIGSNCRAVVETILGREDPMAIRRVRGVLSLTRLNEPAVVDAACAVAVRERQYTFRFVKNLCTLMSQKGGRPVVEKPLTQNHELIRSLDEYQTLVTERGA